MSLKEVTAAHKKKGVFPMTECRFKKALDKENPYCEHTFPECRKEIPICVYEDKYQDLVMDARMAMADIYDCYENFE